MMQRTVPLVLFSTLLACSSPSRAGRRQMPSRPLSSSSSSSTSEDTHKMTCRTGGARSHSSKSPPSSDSSSFSSSDSDYQSAAKRLDLPSTPVVPTPSKKEKAMVAENGSSAGKARRVWTEEKEIKLLNGIVTYLRDGGSLRDLDVLVGFIRNLFNTDVKKNQVVDKLHKLRALYHRNEEKGASVVFHSVHEENIYKISKKIWGEGETGSDDDEDQGVMIANSKREDPLSLKVEEAPVNEVAEPDFAWLFEGQESLYNNYVRGRLPSAEPSVIKGLVEKDAKLRVRIMKLRLKQLEYERELIDSALAGNGAS